MKALGIVSVQTQFKTKKSSISQIMKRLPFAFKTYALITILLWCYQLYPQVSPSFGFGLAYKLVITQIQIWRIFVNLFYAADFLAVFGILFNLFILMQIISAQERTLSTIYVLINIYLSMLVLNGLYLMLAALFSLLFYITSLGVFEYGTFVSGGWWAMAFYQIYKDTAKAPNLKIRFFQSSCIFQNQFLAWLIAVIFLVITKDVLGFLSALLLGNIQGYIIKENLIKLPLCIYRAFDNIFPKFMKKRTDIFTVEKSLHMLKYNCLGYQQPQGYFQQYNSSLRPANQGQAVSFSGQIVSHSQIASASNNPKDFWLKKQQQLDKIEFLKQSQEHAKQFSQKYNTKNQKDQKQNEQQIIDEYKKRQQFWQSKQQEFQRAQQLSQKQNI